MKRDGCNWNAFWRLVNGVKGGLPTANVGFVNLDNTAKSTASAESALPGTGNALGTKRAGRKGDKRQQQGNHLHLQSPMSNRSYPM